MKYADAVFTVIIIVLSLILLWALSPEPELNHRLDGDGVSKVERINFESAPAGATASALLSSP